MRKITWHYDKKNKEWSTGESVPWASDGYTIEKDKDSMDKRQYILRYKHFNFLGRFWKLTSAKQVVELLENG